jgi:molybdopterin-guanine dinucleotide biosynthesis protein A
MSGRLGVLIAGGSGERFGGPKALARYRGETLVARAHAVLAAACDDVVVVAPETLELPVPRAARVADRIADAGPLSALVAGLEARDFTCAFACAVDLPHVESPHVGRLLDAWHDDTALVPAPAGRAQPLAAVYAPAALAPLLGALNEGRRALVPAVMTLGPRLLDDAALAALDLPSAIFEDADTPEALARLEREGAR